jgi:hypothetical protein
MAHIPQAPVPLGDVLKKEQEQIEAVRGKRSASFSHGTPRTPAPSPAAPISGKAPTEADEPDWQTKDTGWVDVIRKAHEMNLVGLAFSGGGIRSATFNLGVLQALADLKLLFRVDYLSTVSGGGYIGAWLAAWTKRLKEGFAGVQKEISTHRVHLKEDKEQPPLRFLRVFSNYLTPKLGIFSGDTGAMVAIYLRNLLLNQAVIFALLATLLLAPRAAVVFLGMPGIWHFLKGAEVLLLLAAFVMILVNMGYVDKWRKAAGCVSEQIGVLLLVCMPLFAAAVVIAVRLAAWSRFESKTGHSFLSWGSAALIGAVAYCVFWGLASLAALIFGKQVKKAKSSSLPSRLRAWSITMRDWSIRIGATLGAGALAGWLLALIASFPALWQYDAAKPETMHLMTLTVGAPLVVGVFLLTGVLHIGLMGILFRDWKREWWGRLGGWLMLFACTWLAFFWLALFFPWFITNSVMVSSLWKALAAALTPAWILSTIGTVLAGNSKATGEPGTAGWKDAAIKVGPYIFVAGLLCLISLGLDCLLRQKELWASWGIIGRFGNNGPLYTTLLVCAAVTLIMAWRVDINQFSMHLFYRNRLAGCFLGASNETRSPNRFTGFDPSDDMPLKDLAWKGAGHPVHYDGPYPILNAALNLVKGKDLAWQERKAESFVMTPLFCGYDVWLEEQDSPMLTSDSASSKKLERFGYRRTEDYAFPPPFHGPNLGLAMGISGAAASPNMGYHSSTPVAFLMTVFNVRLGQWLGNPRHRKTSGRATPHFGLKCLVNELLGGTDDEARYVYLSDGGHFDNMGLYELVKRRCGLIILCDAEADENYTFEGLGNAVRKCRIDLGIDIDLDTSEIAPKKAGGLSKRHSAVGTIHYEYADKDAPTGIIVYFKASLTGTESADVTNYRKEHKSFPHESTVDQWFSESQFESYRQLGYQAVFSSVRSTPPATAGPMQQQLHAIFKHYGFEVD